MPNIRNRNKKYVSAWIDIKIRDRLKAIAKQDGKTLSELVVKMSNEYINANPSDESVKCIRDKSDTDLVESMEVVMARRVGSKSEPKK